MGQNIGNKALTVNCEADEEKHPGLQRNDIHQKVPLIVCPNTVVNPRAMAMES